MRLGLYRKIAEMFSGFEEHGKDVAVQPSQGSPSLHSVRASTLADAPVSSPPVPAPATRSAADPTVPASTFVSSHGETAWKPREDTSRDPYRERSVDDRLQSTIIAATAERNKAVQTVQWTSWALNATIAGQVLIGAMALGAALRGKNKLAAISILGGASTFVASYSARTRDSDKRRALLRVEALDRFLREIEAFQLDHGKEVSREWDEKIDGFRLGLENVLGRSVTINSEAAGNINSSVEKGVGASTDPVSA
ncbi:hypothetical protein EDB87DRAFT_1631155 [Lactarius vividus]|nr:hypothetical protein EDB87DRAFT_1631155 [Lactarius vividus]